MKNYSLLLLAFVFVISCKKKDEFTPNPVPEPAPLTDFLYLPVKDAEWRIHLQTTVIDDVLWCSGQKPGDRDTAVHWYFTIKSTGRDTLVTGVKYFRYDVSGDYVYTKQPCDTIWKNASFGPLFLREDTAGKKILVLGGDEPVVDFSLESVGEDASVSQLWPASFVSGENGIIINGQKSKSWEVSYKYDKKAKFFYKGYGIGSQVGVLPRFWLTWMDPITLDFTYKGKTNHFDFELHP
ncbi:hypothetical protein [Polluticoccus soli]|uniref:hypothetical protein n=1 Tax=Polluticoccus soli TaxID=3034150 RepID=UPI0023E3035D|nr:hypothetical protein [Flavipsychrobacter sp. JY13-12]